jgi:hypothetical protein
MGVISLPKSQLISLGLTTFLNGASWALLNKLVTVCVLPD